MWGLTFTNWYLDRFLSQYFDFSVSVIPATLRTHLHLHVVLTSRTNGRSLGTFRKALLFRKSGVLDRKVLSLPVSLCLSKVKIWHLAGTFVRRPDSNVQSVRRTNQVVAAAVTATVRPTAGSFMWPRTDMTSQHTCYNLATRALLTAIRDKRWCSWENVQQQALW
jgi:hypothetical protein